MEKQMEWRMNHPGLFLVLLCYTVAVLLVFLWHIGMWASNRALYASGYFTPTILQMEDFIPLRLEEVEDGVWVSTSDDPQLILKQSTLRVDTVRTNFTFEEDPLIESVFYADPDQTHSLRHMVYAREGEEGQVYYLPASGVQNLRIDPDSTSGSRFVEGEIILNDPRPFWAFFIPSGTALAILLLAPAFAAALLLTLQEFRAWIKVRKWKKRGAGQ